MSEDTPSEDNPAEELRDDDVPLAPAPNNPTSPEEGQAPTTPNTDVTPGEEKVPEEELPDGPVPLDQMPGTGETMMSYVWFAMLCIAGVALIFLARKKKA